MIEVWGQAPEGSDVQRITLKRGGLSATVISFGAILQDLRLEGHASSLVLGFDTLEAYTKNPQYFGAIVGRFAGRIAGASAEIDGVTYPLDCNFIGKHQLHGGSDGASFRNWALEEHGPDFATFTTILPDRHMGFPGAISLRATYRLLEDATLQLDLEAQTDAPTLCNLTSHNYFTLDGGPDLSHHTLEINAARYIPVDDEGIPSSGVMDVADSAFDYRTARALAEQNQIAVIDQRHIGNSLPDSIERRLERGHTCGLSQLPRFEIIPQAVSSRHADGGRTVCASQHHTCRTKCHM